MSSVAVEFDMSELTSAVVGRTTRQFSELDPMSIYYSDRAAVAGFYLKTGTRAARLIRRIRLAPGASPFEDVNVRPSPEERVYEMDVVWNVRPSKGVKHAANA